MQKHGKNIIRAFILKKMKQSDNNHILMWLKRYAKVIQN